MYPATLHHHRRTAQSAVSAIFFHRLRMSILIFLFLVYSVGVVTPPVAQSADTAPALIARITDFTGTVTIEKPLTNRRPPGLLQSSPPRNPEPMDKLTTNERIQVDAGSTATILCVDNHIHVLGAGRYIITAEWCGNGQALPAESCQQTTGTVCREANSAVIQPPDKDKEKHYGNVPVILSPRQTHLLEGPSTIQWVAVDRAIQYEVRLGSSLKQKMKKEEITCVQEADSSSQICSIPWPVAWRLEAGKTYTLIVAARRTVAERQWRLSEPSELRTLDAATATQLRKNIVAVETLNLDPITQNLVLAGLYSQQQVYSEAIARYQKIVQETAAPALFNTLGDLYRQIELQRYALKAYQAGLDLLDAGPDDPAVRAAAEFGRGQAEYSRLRYTQAEPYFAHAVAMYVAMPVQEEYAAAEYGLGRISHVAKKYDAAKQHYQKALELYKTLGLHGQAEKVKKDLAQLPA